jgi:two-component system NarL family response regulator
MVIHVLLALPRNLMAQGIESYLRQQPSIQLSIAATDEPDAMPVTQGESIDVVLLALDSFQSVSLQRVSGWRHRLHQARVVVLGQFRQPTDVIGTLDAGATACLSVDGRLSDVLQAIEAAPLDRHHFCQSVSRLMLQGVRQRQQGSRDPHGLGLREEEVLRLIADGFSSKQIARQLDIAPSTVDVHRRNIMRKVGLHKVADLTRFAIRHHMVSL